MSVIVAVDANTGLGAPFAEGMEGRNVTGIPAAEMWRAKYEGTIPVEVPLHKITRLGDISEPSNYIPLDYCQIRQAGGEKVTCHFCEGGHHIHIQWPFYGRRIP